MANLRALLSSVLGNSTAVNRPARFHVDVGVDSLELQPGAHRGWENGA